VDLLPEETTRSGYRDAPTGLSEKHRGALRDVDRDPPFSQPPLRSPRYDARKLSSSAGWRDVAKMAILSA